MAVNIGPKIGIDGEAEFRKQLNNIIQQCKTLDSEMKSVTSSFDENDQSQEKLSKQSEVLTRQIQLQIQRIEMLEKGLGEASKKYGETDTKTQKWQQAVNDATTSLNRMQKELDDINSAMKTNAYDDLTKQIENQEKEVKRLRTAYQNAVLEFGDASDEAEELGRELSNVSGELKESRSAMKRAADAADELDRSMDDLDDSAGTTEVSIGSLGDIIGGNVIVNGVQEIIGAIDELHEQSMEYRRIMSSLEISSNQAGYSASETAEAYDKLIGVLGDTQTAATTLQNLQAIGLEQEDLNRIIDISVGAWAKYGDSIPIDSLSEAINETAKTGTVTGTLADAINWATGEEDAFNEELATTKDVTRRAQMIIEKLSESGLEDLGQQWQENNEGMVEYNQSANDLEESLADLGETIEPLLTFLKRGLAEVTSAANDAMTPGFVKILDAAAATAEEMGINFDTLVENYKNLSAEQQTSIQKTLEQHDLNMLEKDGLVLLNSEIERLTGNTAIQNEQADVTAEKTMNLTSAYDQLSEADKKVADAAANATTIEQARALATQERNRVAGISIETAGQELTAYNNLSAAQQQLATDVTNAVLTMEQNVQSAIESQMNMFEYFDAGVQLSTEDMLKNMKSQIEGVRQWEENLTALANRGINENLLQYLAEMGPQGAGYVQTFANMTEPEFEEANRLWQESLDIKGMTNDWGQQLIETGAESIAAGMEGIDSLLESSGADTVMGLVRGMQEAAGDLTTEGEVQGTELLNTINDTLGVHSPSWKMKNTGKDLDNGLIQGIRENQTAVQSAAKYVGYLADQAIKSQLSQSKFYTYGLNITSGLVNGINAGRSRVVNAAASMARAAAEAARSELDINSPSGVFEEIGRYTSEGFLVGFEQNDLKARVGELMDFQQQHVNAIMSLQYQNIDEIYSTVYTAVREGMKQVNGRDNEYMRILDNMSKRPIYTQAYFDGRPMGYMMSPYVSAAQQKETKIKNWVNGVKA